MRWTGSRAQTCKKLGGPLAHHHHHHLSRSCHCWQMASTTCAMHFDPGPFSSIDCQRLPRCHLSISFWVFLLVFFHLWVSTLMLFSPTWCSSGVIDIIEKVKCMKGQWAGHVARMKNTRWAKITSEWTPTGTYDVVNTGTLHTLCILYELSLVSFVVVPHVSIVFLRGFYCQQSSDSAIKDLCADLLRILSFKFLHSQILILDGFPRCALIHIIE